MNFEINKGIGRNVEFKGLESQYLFVFAAGLLAVFVVFVILYMAGVNQWVCIGFGVASASAFIRLISSSLNPLEASIRMLCSLPVPLSFDDTVRIPLASMSKVTSI